MGVGEPDEMAFAESVSALSAAAAKPENRGYADNGARSIQASRRTLDAKRLRRGRHRPGQDVIHSIGSKAALSILPACVINPATWP